MGVCRVLFSVIFFILSRKLLFFVFHYAYHIIDTLENGMEELLQETLPHLLFTRVDHLVDEHNPLAIIALWVVDRIGELIVSVVVYTGTRIGLHVLENMRVNPLETIKESVVDPIKGFVLEKSREYENVFKQYVVDPIGDYAVKNFIKYVLPPIQKYVLPLLRKFVNHHPVAMVILIPAMLKYNVILPLGTPLPLPAPIRKFVLAPFAVPPPIQKYVLDVLAPIRKYVLNPFAVVASITEASVTKKFAWCLIKYLFVLTVIPKLGIQMLAKLAQIQRRLRILHDIRKMKNFRYQFENLRNMIEVVRRLDVDAEANSKAIQPNARKWLTRVKQIIESSNLDGFEEVEKLYSDRLERNFPRFD